MDDKPEKTRPVPVPGVPATTGPTSVTRRTAPASYVVDTAAVKRTAVLTPEELGGRDPEEIKRARKKRKQQAEVERLKSEVEVSAGLRRIRNTVLTIVTLMAAAWGAWAVHQRWGGQWPILFTWFVICGAIIGGFGWALWYLDRGD